MNQGSSIHPSKLFNAKLMEFLDDLVEAFPDDNDFKVCRELLDISIKTFSESYPQEMFNQHIAQKYETFIRNKDEEFFLQEVYDPSITDIQFVNKLKQMWRTIDDHNKDIVWKYMQCLLILNNKCI